MNSTAKRISIRGLFRGFGISFSKYENLVITELISDEENPEFKNSIQPYEVDDIHIPRPPYTIVKVSGENQYQSGEIWIDDYSDEIYFYLGKTQDNLKKDVLLTLKSNDREDLGQLFEVTIGTSVFLHRRIYPF